MNGAIASILKKRLEEGQGLSFVEVYAGLVQTVEYRDPNSDATVLAKRMPVSHDTSIDPECSISPERALVPDSSKKGVLYFEDNGTSFIDRGSGGMLRFRARLTLVVWMNRARITGDSYGNIMAFCIASIIDKLKVKTLKNEGNFMRLQVMPGTISQNPAVFSRYTYDESVMQYLRPPFDFAGVDLTIDYAVHPSCIDEIIINEKACY